MVAGPVLSEFDELTRSHPFLGRPHGGIGFPKGRSLLVKARTDWHRVVILVILAGALEHLAESDNGR